MSADQGGNEENKKTAESIYPKGFGANIIQENILQALNAKDEAHRREIERLEKYHPEYRPTMERLQKELAAVTLERDAEILRARNAEKELGMWRTNQPDIAEAIHALNNVEKELAALKASPLPAETETVVAAARDAKEILKPFLDEPLRSAFWNLVAALKQYDEARKAERKS